MRARRSDVVPLDRLTLIFDTPEREATYRKAQFLTSLTSYRWALGVLGVAEHALKIACGPWNSGPSVPDSLELGADEQQEDEQEKHALANERARAKRLIS